MVENIIATISTSHRALVASSADDDNVYEFTESTRSVLNQVQTPCLKSSTGQNFVVPLLENQELHKTLIHMLTQHMHIMWYSKGSCTIFSSPRHAHTQDFYFVEHLHDMLCNLSH